MNKTVAYRNKAIKGNGNDPVEEDLVEKDKVEEKQVEEHPVEEEPVEEDHVEENHVEEDYTEEDHVEEDAVYVIGLSHMNSKLDYLFIEIMLTIAPQKTTASLCYQELRCLWVVTPLSCGAWGNKPV